MLKLFIPEYENRDKCESLGTLELICGLQNPEDFAKIPHENAVIVSQFAGLAELNEGEIKTRLIRSRFNRKKMTVTNDNKGKLAITRFQLIKSFIINDEIKISYLKCKLMTGRTHQIRVHMAYNGNPIIGDAKYSRNKYVLKLPSDLQEFVKKNFIIPERQVLHARSLGFFHPQKKINMLFKSDLPSDINGLLNKLSKVQ